MNNIFSMIEDGMVDSSFLEELLEFTKANQVEKERKIQQARSRGADQKEQDRERKNINRKQDKQAESSNPWKGVVIVKTSQDGKIRLIPKNDFESGKHELLYGSAPGQPPKPEVTPNVAREVASQDDFEASKTSNRLLGQIKRKKSPKREIIRTDQYDYPKDGVEKVDSRSTYPDWDHAPDQLAQGIALVANAAAGGSVNVDMIKGMFGASQTLMDASIRGFQQLGEKIKGIVSVSIPDESYPTTKEWSEFVAEEDIPATDLLVQSVDGKVYKIAFIQDKTKIIDGDEADVIFTYSLVKTGPLFEVEEKSTKKQLEKLKDKITNFLSNYDRTLISKKYSVSKSEDFKREIISELETILESNKFLEKIIVLESLAGVEKFGPESPATANSLVSMSRDGTDLKFVPLDDSHLRILLGETSLKIRLVPRPEQSPFDELMSLMDSNEEGSQLQEFFNVLEGTSEAKMFFDNFMSESESLLVGFLNLLDLTADGILIENINLDAVGSLSTGNFTKVSIGDRNHYIEVEKDINFYDGSTLQLPSYEMMPEKEPEEKQVQEDVDYLTEKRRNYKKEYEEYHSKTVQKRRRAGRNKIRRKYIRKYGKKKLKGKDIDHKDHNPLNNGSGNVRLRDKSKNRGDNKVPVKEEHGAGDEGTTELLLRYLSDTPYMSIPRDLLKKGNKNATGRKQTKDRDKNK